MIFNPDEYPSLVELHGSEALYQTPPHLLVPLFEAGREAGAWSHRATMHRHLDRGLRVFAIQMPHTTAAGVSTQRWFTTQTAMNFWADFAREHRSKVNRRSGCAGAKARWRKSA